MGITDLDMQRFTQGDCHYLARALNKSRPDLRLAAFQDKNLEPELHAFVLTPKNLVLDIYGLHTKEALKRMWSTHMDIVEMSWSDLSLFGPPEFSRYTYRRAHVVASILLANLKI